MKRPEGRQPTNPNKHGEIEENMNEMVRLRDSFNASYNALRDRNVQLELEIRLERMTGKVVSLADYRAAKKLLEETKQRRPQHLAAS